METITNANDIILLLDNYNQESYLLKKSLESAGIKFVSILLQEDQTKFVDVMSIYEWMSMYIDGEMPQGMPVFYNEIPMLDKWTIDVRNEAKIIYHQQKKGYIHFSETGAKRLVISVDWYDRKEKIIATDYYSRYGYISARQVYNLEDGKPISKTWFSAKGREIIFQNITDNEFIYKDGEEQHIFQSQIDLFVWFLRKLGIHQHQVIYNSLSTPYHILERISLNKNNILFWNEDFGTEIPWNMKQVVDRQAAGTKKIYVQKKNEYKKLKNMDTDLLKFCQLGYIYPYKRKTTHSKNALIFTNSDQLENFEKLIYELPEIHFHVMALTLMSDNLNKYKYLKNVSLYPGVSQKNINLLFEKCDYYFDINYGNEVENSVFNAFLNNQVIFAFCETAHNRNYVLEEHIYSSKNVDALTGELKLLVNNDEYLDKKLKLQQEKASTDTIDNYITALKIL